MKKRSSLVSNSSASSFVVIYTKDSVDKHLNEFTDKEKDFLKKITTVANVNGTDIVIYHKSKTNGVDSLINEKNFGDAKEEVHQLHYKYLRAMQHETPIFTGIHA